MRVLVSSIGAVALTAALSCRPGMCAADELERGRATYMKYCSACHGTAGKGDGPAAGWMVPPPRDHTDRRRMNSLSDGYLAEIIRKGGAAVGQSALMPPGRTLTPEQIADLVAFVRSLTQSGSRR